MMLISYQSPFYGFIGRKLHDLRYNSFEPYEFAFERISTFRNLGRVNGLSILPGLRRRGVNEHEERQPPFWS